MLVVVLVGVGGGGGGITFNKCKEGGGVVWERY